MKENKTQSKLGTGLEHRDIGQTGALKNSASQTARPRFKIKFTDYAIEKFTSSFMVGDRIKLRAYTSFDITKTSVLKGLTLCQYKKSMKKYFLLRYWFNKRACKITIGQFIPGKFGIKQCEDKVYEIAREHQDDKGIWIKNPLDTIRLKETRIERAVIDDSLKLTINEVIVRLCKANFPRAKREGRLTASSIQMKCKDLIGHNWRTRHLVFVDDNKGNGQIHFKANYSKRTTKPEDWDDLFKKFPAGHGINKDKRDNPKGERSVYDSNMGKYVIDELNPGLVRKYIEKKHRSFGTKKNILDTFKTLWAFAIDEKLFGDKIPTNPTKQISFKRPEESKSPGSIYNDLLFTHEQKDTITKTLIKNSDKYPFQTEALLFMMCTGRRAEETLKIKKSMISWGHEIVKIDGEDLEIFGKINMPSSITKARRKAVVYITAPVKWVLDKLNTMTSGTYQAYKFLDWMFPTTRINKKRLHDDYYVRSDQCRVKELRGCWRAMAKETGIFGAIKSLRKYFATYCIEILGSSSEGMFMSDHMDSATMDRSYNKAHDEKLKNYAVRVAKIFDFKKASNE